MRDNQRVETTKSKLDWQHSIVTRAVHAMVAVMTLSGLVSSLYLGWTRDTELPTGVGYTGGLTAGWHHMLNQPAYFTVISGLMVCVTSAMLTLNTRRRSAVFHAVRIGGVVCVIITGIVFNILLRGPGTMTGVMAFNDTVLHVIAPLAVPLVWLILGPHGGLSARSALGSTIIPLAWRASL